MSVRVRLTRVGSRKNPIWRVVVADQRSPRDGRVIETVGRYNAQTEPSEIVLDRERLTYWIDRGAQPSAVVKKLMRTLTGGTPPAQRAAAPEPEAAVPEQKDATPEVEASSSTGHDAAPEAGPAATEPEDPAPDVESPPVTAANGEPAGAPNG